MLGGRFEVLQSEKRHGLYVIGFRVSGFKGCRV